MRQAVNIFLWLPLLDGLVTRQPLRAFLIGQRSPPKGHGNIRKVMFHSVHSLMTSLSKRGQHEAERG